MKFLISDMTCGHCASVITKAVVAAETTAEVRIDIGAKTVTVTTAAGVDVIANAIIEAGYTPELQAA